VKQVRPPSIVRPPVAALLAGWVCFGCAAVEGARLYHSGSRALERGEAARAVADLEGAAARLPHASEVHNRLGIAYAASGRREDAMREFRSAVALDCENAAARRNLRAALGEAKALP
jgi:Flp pilus assembly protein TadD